MSENKLKDRINKVSSQFQKALHNANKSAKKLGEAFEKLKQK